MALTTEDLNNIKHLFDDRFAAIDRQFASIDRQFAAVRGDIDDLALATAKQFAHLDERFTAFESRLDEIGDDMTVIKDMVKDHSFRITRLEH